MNLYFARNETHPGDTQAPWASSTSMLSAYLASRAGSTSATEWMIPPSRYKSPLTTSRPSTRPVHMVAFRISVGLVPGWNLSETARRWKSGGGPGFRSSFLHFSAMEDASMGTLATRMLRSTKTRETRVYRTSSAKQNPSRRDFGCGRGRGRLSEWCITGVGSFSMVETRRSTAHSRSRRGWQETV